VSAVVLEAAGVELGRRTVWREVNVRIEPGQFVAVLGPNGSGKSTLVKVIVGLVPLASGRVEVLGRAPVDARADIGYLPQRRNFDASLRVRGVDIVRLGLDGHRWGMPLPGAARWSERGRAARRRVDEVLELVRATDFADRPVGEISGGQQQRLLIAQALIRRPELLLLDEPLDSLDLPNQSAVAALIAGIAHGEGVTVLLVAHDVNPILGTLDGVVYFGNGTAASGLPRDVITTETLTRLYGSRVEVLQTSDGRLVAVGQPEVTAHHHDRHEHR
jgi:zinc/manganese transport system ATP-binding protein